MARSRRCYIASRRTGGKARLAALRAGFRRVEKYAPFLVQYESGRLRLRDGNHRYAALGSLHMGECWIIVWYANAEEYRHNETRGFRVQGRQHSR